MTLLVNNFEVKIIFEDADILVVHKPAGVIVNEADSVSSGTLQSSIAGYLADQKEYVLEKEWTLQVPEDFDPQYGGPSEIFAQRAGMVHRLDKDTSGVMIFAKHPGSLVSLLAQFRDRTAHKKYVCLVHGVPALKENYLNFPIGRSSRDRQKFAVVAHGRNALTHYTVTETFSRVNLDLVPELTDARLNLYHGFALLLCEPKTGRTHQIRVHMAHIGNPLVGDRLYVGKRSRLDAAWCPRQFLHAQELTVLHPRTKIKQTFNDPLPADLEAALKVLVPTEDS